MRRKRRYTVTLSQSDRVGVNWQCELRLYCSRHLLPVHSWSTAALPAMSGSVRSSAASSADALIDARVVQSTKDSYQSKINLIKQFYTEYLHLSDLTLPVERDDIHSFFGWLIDTKHKDKPAAFSTVRQYKSALVWYYKEHKLIIQPEIDQGLETLLNGYKRRVSDYKLEGKMPVFAGKYHRHLTVTVCWPLLSSKPRMSARCCLAGRSSSCSGISSPERPPSPHHDGACGLGSRRTTDQHA